MGWRAQLTAMTGLAETVPPFSGESLVYIIATAAQGKATEREKNVTMSLRV